MFFGVIGAEHHAGTRVDDHENSGDDNHGRDEAKEREDDALNALDSDDVLGESDLPPEPVYDWGATQPSWTHSDGVIERS